MTGELGGRITPAAGDGTENGNPRVVTVLASPGRVLRELRQGSQAHSDGSNYQDRQRLARAYESRLRRVSLQTSALHSRAHDPRSLWANETYVRLMAMGATYRQARREESKPWQASGAAALLGTERSAMSLPSSSLDWQR